MARVFNETHRVLDYKLHFSYTVHINNVSTFNLKSNTDKFLKVYLYIYAVSRLQR